MPARKTPNLTLTWAAKCAIGALDAVNASGINNSFREIQQEVLWPAARAAKLGTEWVNRNPISVLFTWKLMDLALGTSCPCEECSRRFSEAYAVCREIADAEPTKQIPPALYLRHTAPETADVR